MQYGLDYSAGELTPAQAGSGAYTIDFLIRYIGYPANGKCISHYPGAYARHTAAGRTVLLVAEGSTHDAAGGFSGGVAMAQRALADARSIGYPDTLPIFLCADGWLSSQATNALASVMWVVSFSAWASGINSGIGVVAPFAAVGAFLTR